MLAWCGQFLTAIESDPPAYGLTQSEVDDIEAVIDDLTVNFNLHGVTNRIANQVTAYNKAGRFS